jgi:hypothetical protein
MSHFKEQDKKDQYLSHISYISFEIKSPPRALSRMNETKNKIMYFGVCNLLLTTVLPFAHNFCYLNRTDMSVYGERTDGNVD